MAEPKGKPPHAGERLTREDVLRLIEEHGGPEDLDLREADLSEADLSGLDLHGADLFSANLQGARFFEAKSYRADFSEAEHQEAVLSMVAPQRAVLRRANLRGARLWLANLQGAVLYGVDLQGADLSGAKIRGANLVAANLQGANLWVANLQGANLWLANLQGANLNGANLQEATLSSTNLQGANLLAANLQGAGLEGADLRRAGLAGAILRDARLERANWGNYVLGEEIEGNFGGAASVYRTLKQRHTEAGMYDIAGEFHYREMEARRKQAKKERRRLPYALGLGALGTLYGYGERPLLVVVWAAAIVFGFALVHWAFGTVAGGFLEALYYSAVSFTALGYGTWAPEPQGWAGRFLGAGESFLGVFMMALFLVTFTRKMTR